MVRKITGSVLQPLSCSCLRSLLHEAALLPAERIGCSLVEKTVRDRDANVCFRSPVSKRVQQVVVPQRNNCPFTFYIYFLVSDIILRKSIHAATCGRSAVSAYIVGNVLHSVPKVLSGGHITPCMHACMCTRVARSAAKRLDLIAAERDA